MNPQRTSFWGFPGGSVVKNPPADAGDTCSIPGPEGSQVPMLPPKFQRTVKTRFIVQRTAGPYICCAVLILYFQKKTYKFTFQPTAHFNGISLVFHAPCFSSLDFLVF